MKNIVYTLMFLGALLAGTVQMYAVKAYPWPVQVTQPDGSVITIQKHGDEFLHWTTSGGRLVTQGKDGFYYWASFSPEGRKIPTSVRVQQGAMPLSMQQVTPSGSRGTRSAEKIGIDTKYGKNEIFIFHFHRQQKVSGAFDTIQRFVV